MEPENVLVMNSCPLYTGKASLKPIGPIAPQWARSCWNYLLLAIQVHTTTHYRFDREQHYWTLYTG